MNRRIFILSPLLFAFDYKVEKNEDDHKKIEEELKTRMNKSIIKEINAEPEEDEGH